MKILSVDDKAENLYMVEALLRGHGHEVDSASNGLDALQLAQRGRYDLIVSDILMPRMDGFQLCREVKKDPRLRDIPVVFYTATYTDSKDAAFALSLGAARFLTKPLDPERFVSEIESVAHETRKALTVEHGEPPLEEEAIYLKEYNARLIAKLEKKMLDLEAANKALQEDLVERERFYREREQLEQQLHRAQRMEAIGTLAGGIAHDFNNILAGISGYAELGLREAGDRAATTLNLTEILRAAQRARELVNQILTFSQQREQPRSPQALDLVVEEAWRGLQPVLDARVKVSFTADPELPAVLADASQLHQVATNLITNAAHAIGAADGQINLRLRRLEIDEELAQRLPGLYTGEYVEFSITDTGHGMSAGVADRIFEPFYTTKEAGKGTGLGLSVVHGIVQACDGAIAVESAPGSGTTFRLYFPAVARPLVERSRGPGEVPRGRGECVLLLDDEPVVAALGERLLRRLGYEPLVLTDAAEALVRLREKEVALVVTDLTMPVMSGLDFARAAWRLRPDLPVILTTGYTASLDHAKTLALGFRDLLVKPYNLQSLARSIHAVVHAPTASVP